MKLLSIYLLTLGVLLEATPEQVQAEQIVLNQNS